MARWDLRIQGIRETTVLPPDAKQVLIEGDVGNDIILSGHGNKLRIQIDGDLKPDSQVRLSGPDASLVVKGSIKDALILLEGCSLDVNSSVHLGRNTHIHARGNCGKIHTRGQGTRLLLIEPCSEKETKVQIGSEKRSVPAMPQMKATNWLPFLLPGSVPELHPFDSRKGSAATYGGFTMLLPCSPNLRITTSPSGRQPHLLAHPSFFKQPKCHQLCKRATLFGYSL